MNMDNQYHCVNSIWDLLNNKPVRFVIVCATAAHILTTLLLFHYSGRILVKPDGKYG